MAPRPARHNSSVLLRLFPYALAPLVALGALACLFLAVPFWFVALVLFTTVTAAYVYAWLAIRALVRRTQRAYQLHYWRYWEFARLLANFARWELRRRVRTFE